MKKTHSVEFDTNQWPHKTASVTATFEVDSERNVTMIRGFYSIESTQPLEQRDIEELEEYILNDRKDWL